MSDLCFEKNTKTFEIFEVEPVLLGFLCGLGVNQLSCCVAHHCFGESQEADAHFSWTITLIRRFLYCLVFFFAVNRFCLVGFFFQKKFSLMWEALGSRIDLQALKPWMFCTGSSVLWLCATIQHFSTDFYMFRKCRVNWGHCLQFCCHF